MARVRRPPHHDLGHRVVGHFHPLVGGSRTVVRLLPRVHCVARPRAVASPLVARVEPRARARVARRRRRALLLALGRRRVLRFRPRPLQHLGDAHARRRRRRSSATTRRSSSGIGTWIFFRRRREAQLLDRPWRSRCPAPRSSWLPTPLGPQGSSRDTDRCARCRLVAAAFFAAYLLATEHVREEMDTLTFSTIAVAGSVLTLLAVCAIVGAPLSGFSVKTWLAR